MGCRLHRSSHPDFIWGDVVESLGMTWSNQRPGVDAGWRVSFAFQRPWPRATQGER
jgi:hypothetical protein